MTKLEIYTEKFTSILNAIEVATMKLRKLKPEMEDAGAVDKILADLDSAYGQVEDEMYMALAPLEMEEEEKQEEIRVLERRLAELKGQ